MRDVEKVIEGLKQETIREITKKDARPEAQLAWYCQRQSKIVRACLKSFDKNGGVGDNRKKQAGAGENASISK